MIRQFVVLFAFFVTMTDALVSPKIGLDLKPASITLKRGLPDYKSESVELNSLLAGKKVIILTVPGAFTPGCSKSHLPSFVNSFDELKQKGVDSIICTATNDAHVMRFWGENQNCGDKVTMLSDDGGALVDFMGEVKQEPCMKRSNRYTMVVDDGVISGWFPGVGTDGAKAPENAWAPNVLANL